MTRFRIPLTRDGAVAMLAGSAILAVAAVAAAFLFWPLAIPLGLIWVWLLAFFRDPDRRGDFQKGDVCAPADGTVTEVRRMDHDEWIGGPAIRISIFLSIFNVHINRSPCDATVKTVRHKPGKFLNAMKAQSSDENESNSLLLAPDDLPGPMMVRQITGAIARRIVCHARPGDALRIGQRFGMIRFGSRTEITLPDTGAPRIQVAPGQKVRAGLTVVATYETSVLETASHGRDSQTGAGTAALRPAQTPA